MAQPGTLFVMARVPEAIREALMRVLAAGGLDAKLGRGLYPPRNWHQSLSDLHPPEAREAMRRACAELDAQAFHLPLDQLRSSGSEPGRIHWAFAPSAGSCDGLAVLMAGLRERLHVHGIVETQGHRPHVTVSYNASQRIGTLDIPPVSWPIDAIELVQVAGRGADYRYEVVGAWPLRAAGAPPPVQLGLLG